MACRAAQRRRARAALPPAARPRGRDAALLRRAAAVNQKDVDTFERLALGLLEPGAAVRSRRRAAGAPDTVSRRRVSRVRSASAARRRRRARAARAAARDSRRRARTGTSWSRSATARAIRHGLVAGRLGSAGARCPASSGSTSCHRRARWPARSTSGCTSLLPGIEEVRASIRRRRRPRRAAAGACRRTATLVHVARDREEEVAGFARRVKARRARRDAGAASIARRSSCTSRCRTSTWRARCCARPACRARCSTRCRSRPSRARPRSTWCCSAVGTELRARPGDRAAAVAAFPLWRVDGERLAARDVAALDRALAEHGVSRRPACAAGAGGARGRRGRRVERRQRAAARPARAARSLRRRRRARRRCARAAAGRPTTCDVLLAFLDRARAPSPGPDDPLRARQLRARGAILGTLAGAARRVRALRPEPRRRSTTRARRLPPLDRGADVRAAHRRRRRARRRRRQRAVRRLRRRAAGRPGRGRVAGRSAPQHLLFAVRPARARLAGRAGAARRRARRVRRPAAPAGARASSVSTFPLEADALVSAVAAARRAGARGTRRGRGAAARRRGSSSTRRWASTRCDRDALEPWPRALGRAAAAERPAAREHRGSAARPPAIARAAYSLSALERYQDCPFKFFAADVLRLEEPPEDESALSPRARGRFVHEVLQRFFEAWDRAGLGPITADTLDRRARRSFAAVAEPLLAALRRRRRRARAHAAVRLGHLAGRRRHRAGARGGARRPNRSSSAGSSTGSRASSRSGAGRRARWRCAAWPIGSTCCAGRRLRVIDYKSGRGADAEARAAGARSTRCARRSGWRRATAPPGRCDEAAYVALGGPSARSCRSSRRASHDADERAGRGARAGCMDVLDGIARGEFPPRPLETR